MDINNKRSLGSFHCNWISHGSLMVSMLDSKLLSRFEPWQGSLHCALGQSTFQNSCNASLHPIVYMGSTEFNTRGNPAMDCHLIHAIQTAICSNGSMDHHPFEIITFFWDQWATWEDNVVLRKHYIKWPLNKNWNGSFQNHSFQRHENKQKLSLTHDAVSDRMTKRNLLTMQCWSVTNLLLGGSLKRSWALEIT